MTAHLEEDFDIATYKASKRQQYVKYKLHQCISPQEIGQMTIKNIHRVRHYFYPIEMEEIIGWAMDSSVFWQWLVIANEQIFELNALRPSAVGCIKSILEGDVADSKMAQTQLKAAQLLLSMSDKPPTHVTQNTMNIGGERLIPKALAKKTPAQIQEEILKLQKTVDISAYNEQGED